MQFSPLILVRQPIYTLAHLDAFALDMAKKEPTEDDIEALRVKFLSLIHSKHLLLSLPFSSKSVYNAIAHYEFHAAVKIRKKEKQSERAFMKYLMRMVLNPSPLANFSGSQFCDWTGHSFPPKAKFRIDLALAQRKEFFDLCYCDQGLQDIMRHRLNPSLRFEGDGFAYIHKDADDENVVRIETSPDFEKLYNTLKSSDFTFAEFVEQCEFDVNDFLEAQLITPSYPHYSASTLIARIIESVNERYELGFTIEELEGRSYKELDDKAALAVQADWIRKINAYAKKLKVSLNDSAYSERVFYLNSALEKCAKPEFDKELISTELVRLIAIIQSTQIHEVDNDSFDDLNQDIVCPAPKYAYDKVKLNPVAGSSYLEFKIDTAPSRISENFIAPIGVMLQHTKGHKPNLVNVTTAYGKFFAPALPLATDEVKGMLQDWLGEGSEDKVVLKDASLHSKNKAHAYLRELDNFGLDFHTAVSDRVRVNLVKGELQDESNGKAIEVVNLGIEDVDSRSPLLRNLQKMTHSLPNIPEFMERVQDMHEVQFEGGISLRPRIESEHLILAMQTWIISEKGQFPELSNDLGPDMMVLNTWRQDLKIPRIVCFSFDDKKSNYLDFHNPWSIDIFLRSIKNMEAKCAIKEFGLLDDVKDRQLVETYFEFKTIK